MRRLGEIASILRSKNAGPLVLTIDIVFADKEDYLQARKSGNLSPEVIGSLYDVDPALVQVIGYDVVNSIKIAMPRKRVSGSLADDDIYGCQQHMPLYGILIAERER